MNVLRIRATSVEACWLRSRNSNYEIRNPKEARNSKSENYGCQFYCPGEYPATLTRHAALAIRASGFGFLSDFGFWISGLMAALAIGLLLVTPASATTNGAPARNIGIEGQVSVALPRPDYRPRPLDDRTELILRVESVTAVAGGQHRYDFYYIGLEPGPYNLADYLMRPDGSRPDELGDIRIHVRALLPEDHDGQLNAYQPRAFPWIGGYRAFLGTLGVLWIGGIVAYAYFSRRKRPVVAPVILTPPPSLADRLRPLVEAAAAGQITPDGQARLERLLMGYWREKLNLPELRMAEALMRLKEHAEAGALLRALERWLHRPGGVSQEEVTALLRPYQQIPAPALIVEGGAK